MNKFQALFIYISFSLFKTYKEFTMAIHAGAIDETEVDSFTEEKEKNFKQGLKEALRIGYNILREDFGNETHLDAVQKALNSLENNPIFNSGRGAKVNTKFECELDASIINGVDQSCGAVAGVKRIKNPINAARLVKDKTRHVLLIGQGAETFAEGQGLTMVPNSYFMTQEMKNEWYDLKAGRITGSRHGTCGAIALDQKGNLGAGTTTGGITGKMAGRIGDSPIIGAGTYAKNGFCAVSCTGIGENMIRRSIAHDVCARMEYKNITLQQSSDEIMEELEEKTGGFIAIDGNGEFYSPFNTPGLARAWVSDNGNATIILFNETADKTPLYYDLNE